MSSEILVIRLGAMGDILHALPAVATLRRSFPQQKISWAVAPKWIPLLEGNPNVDVLLPFDRTSPARLLQSLRRFRNVRPNLAIDFQGLIQSALLGRMSRPHVYWGWNRSVVRESLAALFYTHAYVPHATHKVETNLELAQAAGATSVVLDFYIPAGREEGILPDERFVLTSPFAGWAAKQWPLEFYEMLANRLKGAGIRLVANMPPQRARELSKFPSILKHTSSLQGLIYATRRAAAVVGLDSGPLHLAAALGKPGVALYGPTDPAINGPFGSSIHVLRTRDAMTSYKRGDQVDTSMRAISVDQVYENLMRVIAASERGGA
jgi:lipopolysaccharide heptosyltransferase I